MLPHRPCISLTTSCILFIFQGFSNEQSYYDYLRVVRVEVIITSIFCIFVATSQFSHMVTYIIFFY